MPTNRTRIGRPPVMVITDEAIALFRKMERLESRCTCPPPAEGREYYEYVEPCKACRRWDELHALLVEELRLRPWQWPAYRAPGTSSRPDAEAEARYRVLAAAAEQRRNGT